MTSNSRSGRLLPAGLAIMLTAGAGAQTQFAFLPPVDYALGFPAFATSVDAGDLDGDQFVDLVLAGRNSDGLMTIFWGNGPGTFGAPVTVEVGGQTNWAAIAHLNGDEHLDLAVSHRQGLGRVSIYLGNGTRTLPDPVDYFVGRAPGLIRVADMDDDGALDLVVLNDGTFDIAVLRNLGDGSFVQLDRVPVNPVVSGSSSPNWAHVVDLDGDTDLDIAAVSLNAHDVVHLLFNRGDGTFDPAVQSFVPGIVDLEAMSTLAAGDFDGDGDVDLITKTGDITFIDRMFVLENDGSGRFAVSTEVQLSAGLGGSPWDITAGDFDGDEAVDLAWVTHALSTRSAAFLRNEGDMLPTFTTPEQAFTLGGFPRVALVTDIDLDTDSDLVVANLGNHRVSVLENLLVQGVAAGPHPPPAPSVAAPSAPVPAGPASVPVLPTLEALARGRSLAIAPIPHPSSLIPRGDHQAAGATGVCGNPDAGDCFEPHETPGCNDEACCTLVCEQLALCCVLAWDESCVDVADDLCEPPPACPAEGSCFEAHATSGCDDFECCELVCQFDGFCCGAVWDQLCVDEAIQVCDRKACRFGSCPIGATVEQESRHCGDRVNDGCNLEQPAFTTVTCGEVICGTTWTSGARDTDWYEITVDEITDLKWSVSAEFPTELFIVSGSCTDTYTVIAGASGDPCGGWNTVRQVVDPGTYYLYVAPGTSTAPVNSGVGCIDDSDELINGGAFGGRYNARALCNPGCLADVDGDGAVGADDFLQLLVAWGTDPGGPPDLNGDGVVDTVDLQAMLAAWGPC